MPMNRLGLTQEIGSAREKERFFFLNLHKFRFCGKILQNLSYKLSGKCPNLNVSIEILPHMCAISGEGHRDCLVLECG